MSALRAIVWLGAGKASLGVVAVALHPEIMATSNGAGVPAYLPHGVSLALMLCSLAAWSPRIFGGVLSASYALGAAAFGNPALRACGWPVPPFEALLVVVAFAAGALGLYPGLPRVLVVALLWIPAACGMELLVLGVRAPGPWAAFADATFYTTLLAGGALAAYVGARIRRAPSWIPRPLCSS